MRHGELRRLDEPVCARASRASPFSRTRGQVRWRYDAGGVWRGGAEEVDGMSGLGLSYVLSSFFRAAWWGMGAR